MKKNKSIACLIRSLFLLLILNCHLSLQAQQPACQLKTCNDTLIDSKNYKFDVYIRAKTYNGTTSFNLRGFQGDFQDSIKLLKGTGTLSATVVTGSSNISSNPDQRPTSITFKPLATNPIYFQINPALIQSNGMTIYDSTTDPFHNSGWIRVCTVQLTNTIDFVQGRFNVFHSTSSLYKTIIMANYPDHNTNYDIPCDTATYLTNPFINVPLTAFNVLGTGIYFTNKGIINLSGSEKNCAYKLVLNGLIIDSTERIGTGNPISWLNKDAGNYTVVGRRIATYIKEIPMNGNAIISILSSRNLMLKVYLEGMYNSNTATMNKIQNQNGDIFNGTTTDSISVQLVNDTQPYTTVASFNTLLNYSGYTNNISLPIEDTSNYYIVVKHRNSIELWSSEAVKFTATDNFFDFTTDANSTLSSTIKKVNDGIYCMYSGDVNKDGVINLFDFTDVFDLICNPNAPTGYLQEDINGDGVVNIFDLMLVFDNFLVSKSDPTQNSIPKGIITTNVFSITGNSAAVNCNVLGNGGPPILNRGLCWGNLHNPTIMNNHINDSNKTIGSYKVNVSGLLPNTVYYTRAYATNKLGTTYGNEISFTTLAVLPTLSTTNISSLGLNSVNTGGSIINNGGDVLINRGVCYSTSPNPTINNSTIYDIASGTSFTSYITGLSNRTTYYLRAFATNIAGTAYGNEISFTTQSIDLDGNIYDAITIGTQIWMKQNLKTTHYQNGDNIPNIIVDSIWNSLSTGACSNYLNDTNISNTYGKYYNWYAVADSRNLCPIGWHIPSNSDIIVLENYLGGDSIAGGKLKEAGTTHWGGVNIGATNETNFTALPGGFRFAVNGGLTWNALGYEGHLWLSNEVDIDNASLIGINYNSKAVFPESNNKKWGFNVRCIKN